MLKRLEVYVDAALLSFVVSVVVVLMLSVFGRVIAMLLGGGTAVMMPVMLTMIGLSLVIGATLSIWLSRSLHRHTVGEPLTTAMSHKVAWVALGVGISAPLLGGLYLAFGTQTPVLWLTVAALLMLLAVALVADAVIDLVKAREHTGIDILRFLLVGLLAFALVASMIQPAPLGSEQDISPWVVWVTVAMLVEALLAFGVDEYAKHRAATHGRHAAMPVG